MLARPALGLRLAIPELIAFWARVDVRGVKECWPWKGPLKRGYGKVKRKDKNHPAHRFAHWLVTGEWPEAVMHSCDNRACCNPGHLSSGTTLLNIEDKVAKGRQPRWESHGRAKLNWAKVDAIRASLAPGAELARLYEVSPQLISAVRKFQVWVR